MTFQMYLLEREMETNQKRSEEIALKKIRRGRPIQEIHEDTGLPIQRLEQLAKGTNHAE